MNRRSFILATICAPFVPRLITRPLPIPGTYGAIIRSTTPMWNPNKAWMGPAQKEAYKEISELINIIQKME